MGESLKLPWAMLLERLSLNKREVPGTMTAENIRSNKSREAWMPP